MQNKIFMKKTITNIKLLIINGPNLNMLGKRDPAKYGIITLKKIELQLSKIAHKYGCALSFFQSNHEGEIIDFLQKGTSRRANGILINPGALVRYGYCLRQALIDFGKPVVEVHLSNINKTGVNKKVNVFEDIRINQVIGLKEKSYYLGLKRLINYLKNK